RRRPVALTDRPRPAARCRGRIGAGGRDRRARDRAGRQVTGGRRRSERCSDRSRGRHRAAKESRRCRPAGRARGDRPCPNRAGGATGCDPRCGGFPGGRIRAAATPAVATDQCGGYSATRYVTPAILFGTGVATLQLAGLGLGFRVAITYRDPVTYSLLRLFMGSTFTSTGEATVVGQ